MVAAKQLGRRGFAAEIVDEFYEAAVERVQETKRDYLEEQDSQSGLEDWE